MVARAERENKDCLRITYEKLTSKHCLKSSPLRMAGRWRCRIQTSCQWMQGGLEKTWSKSINWEKDH